MTWPIDSAVIEYRVECYVNGIPRALTAFPNRTMQVGQRTTCPLEFASPIELSANRTPASVRIGCVTTAGILAFPYAVGYFLFEQSEGAPRRNKGALIDVTWKLGKSSTSAITWSGRAPVAAITDILTEAGFENSEIGFIYDVGSAYTFGKNSSVTIPAGTPLKRVFDRALAFCGLTWYVDPNGALFCIPALTVPGATQGVIFASGANNQFVRPTGTRGMTKPKRRYTTDEFQVKTYTARGQRQDDGTTPNATLTASDIEFGTSKSGSFEDAQDNTTCTIIVKRELRRQSGQTRLLTFQCDFDPRLRPGQTIGLLSPEIQLGSSTSARIQGISNQGGIATLTVTLGSSAVAGDVTYDPDPTEKEPELLPGGFVTGELPTASIAYRIDYEKDSSGNAIYSVRVTGEGSYSSSFGDLTYNWTATAGAGETVSPASSSEESLTFVYSSLTDATLELTVTDSAGTSPTITLDLDDPTIDVYSRMLSYVLAGAWEVIYDPDKSAASFAPAGETAVAVPRYNEGPYLWCIFTASGNTKAYRRDPENFTSNPEQAGTTITGTSQDIYIGEPFISENLTNTVLIATGSTITYSRNANDTTPTWQTTASLGTGNITRVIVSAFDEDLWYATVDNKLRTSTDGGATWSDLVTSADASAVAEDVALGPAAGGAVAFSGASTDARRVSYVDAGFTTDWSAITFAAGEDVTSITPLLSGDGYKVASSDGTIYELILSGTTFTASELGQTDASGNIETIVRDGKLDLAYAADATGLYKQSDSIDQIVAGDCDSVGYGVLRVPPKQTRLLIPTTGLSGGGVYEYAGGSWTLRNNGLPATTLYGQGVVAEPNNPDIWYAVFTTNADGDVQVASGELVGNDGSTPVFWRWDGSTWSSVALSIASITAGSEIEPDAQALSIRASGWAVAVRRAVTGTSTSYVFEGVGTSQTTLTTTNNYGITSIDISANGDVVGGTTGSSASTGSDPVLYIRSGTITEPAGTTGDQDYTALGTYPTGNRALWCSFDTPAGGLWYAPDYTTAQPTQILGAGTAGSVVITAGERVYVGGGPSLTTRTGIAEVLDVAGTPSTTVVAASGVAVGRIGMDRQTRSLVAALNSAKDTVYLWDGTTETTIDATSLTAANLRDFVEVLA
jgi:hypothetical protein